MLWEQEKNSVGPSVYIFYFSFLLVKTKLLPALVNSEENLKTPTSLILIVSY